MDYRVFVRYTLYTKSESLNLATGGRILFHADQSVPGLLSALLTFSDDLINN